MQRLLLLLSALLIFGTALLAWQSRSSVSREQLFQQALQGLERGDFNLTSEAIPVLQQDPAYREHVELLKTVTLLKRKRFVIAWERLAEPPAEQSLKPYWTLYRSVTLHGLNLLPEAVAELAPLVEADPTNAQALRWLGVIYYDLGAYEPARRILTKLTTVDPGDYRPWRLLALMHKDFGQFGEAADFYGRALALNPPPELREEMAIEQAESLIELRDYTKALGTLPPIKSARVLRLRAQCEFNLGQLPAADRLLQQARQVESPPARELLLLEAEMAIARGDDSQAEQILQEAARTYPHDAEVRYRWGLCLRKLGQEEAAEREFAAWEVRKNLATELTQLNLAAVGNPWDADLRDRLAELCEQTGKPELALMWRKAAAACRAVRRE